MSTIDISELVKDLTVAARALEEMQPLWIANTESAGDGIDQRVAVRLARGIGGLS